MTSNKYVICNFSFFKLKFSKKNNLKFGHQFNFKKINLKFGQQFSLFLTDYTVQTMFLDSTKVWTLKMKIVVWCNFVDWYLVRQFQNWLSTLFPFWLSTQSISFLTGQFRNWLNSFFDSDIYIEDWGNFCSCIFILVRFKTLDYVFSNIDWGRMYLIVVYSSVAFKELIFLNMRKPYKRKYVHLFIHIILTSWP